MGTFHYQQDRFPDHMPSPLGCSGLTYLDIGALPVAIVKTSTTADNAAVFVTPQQTNYELTDQPDDELAGEAGTELPSETAHSSGLDDNSPIEQEATVSTSPVDQYAAPEDTGVAAGPDTEPPRKQYEPQSRHTTKATAFDDRLLQEALMNLGIEEEPPISPLRAISRRISRSIESIRRKEALPTISPDQIRLAWLGLIALEIPDKAWYELFDLLYLRKPSIGRHNHRASSDIMSVEEQILLARIEPYVVGRYRYYLADERQKRQLSEASLRPGTIMMAPVRSGRYQAHVLNFCRKLLRGGIGAIPDLATTNRPRVLDYQASRQRRQDRVISRRESAAEKWVQSRQWLVDSAKRSRQIESSRRNGRTLRAKARDGWTVADGQTRADSQARSSIAKEDAWLVA